MDQLGSYKFLEVLGHGGMGTVYRGRHTVEAFALRQGGDVAVKILHPQFASNEAVIRRFRREAEIGIQLHHPHIVRVLDLVQDADKVGLVMELVVGGVARGGAWRYVRQHGGGAFCGLCGVVTGVCGCVCSGVSRGEGRGRT